MKLGDYLGKIVNEESKGDIETVKMLYDAAKLDTMLRIADTLSDETIKREIKRYILSVRASLDNKEIYW